MSKPVILTGIRANNDLHIGNYLGALLPLIDMAVSHADKYQINLFIPDLHSFTTPIDHSSLQAQIHHNVRTFIAAGLPLASKNIYMYRQSFISAHSELTWILDCFTGFGEMNRMTQFKDKSLSLSADRISVGLFNYPVLMAADYLLYGASYIPVGDDQSQHLEYGRHIAMRMNNQFGDLFVVPKPVKEQHRFFGKDQGLRIHDLTDPRKKMSKSDATGKGVIFMSDSPEVATKKIMSATTDSLGCINYDPQEQPGITNLLDLLALFTNQPVATVTAAYRGQTQYGPLKQAVAAAIAKFLQAFQAKLLQVDQAAIETRLLHDEAIIRNQADATLLRVQQAIGLRPLVSS